MMPVLNGSYLNDTAYSIQFNNCLNDYFKVKWMFIVKNGLELSWLSIPLTIPHKYRKDRKMPSKTLPTESFLGEYPGINNAAVSNMLVKLVHTGGVGLAKVILHHYGESVGRLGAQWIKEKMRPGNDEDWINYLPQYVEILGLGKFSITKLYMDKADDNYQLHGNLDNSYFAEFYRKEFGKAPETVDWLINGVISGYITEIVKVPVVFRETLCTAKGDNICEFVGKSKTNIKK
jgi:predicted hydrocarbon binding protein